MADSPAWQIERIRKDHERASFDCGVEELNVFLRKYARQSEEFGLARTFVATTHGTPKVFGYYTVRNGEVEVQNLRPEETKRFPRYPVPVVHLARLAVDRTTQGQRLGERLLLNALERALMVSRSVAAYAVEVVAINDAAKRFYLKHGFQELLDDRLHLYLSTKTVAKLLGVAILG
jgi:ribosomal protein S18 acetylase RimI-like enzyme